MSRISMWGPDMFSSHHPRSGPAALTVASVLLATCGSSSLPFPSASASLAGRARLVYTGGEATQSEETIRPRTHANSLRVPVHAAQSPRQACLARGGETRALPSLVALRLGSDQQTRFIRSR